MLASLLLDIATVAAPSISMGFAGWQANTYYRHKAERAEQKVKGKSLAEVIQQGNNVVAQMAADVRKLYHPPDEDGNPCACAYCEIKADDEPAEPSKDVTINWFENGKWRSQTGHEVAYGCNVCGATTPSMYMDSTPQKKVWCADHWKWGKELPVEPDREVSPAYVHALKQKIDGLRKENFELRKGKGEKVVTKTIERQSVLDQQIKQCAEFADQGQEAVKLDLEIQGRPIQVIVGPQREPDEKVVSFGGEVVRPIWHDRPASGPGSQLGIMDRQLGTIGHRCDYCRKNAAWKYSGTRLLCKECYEDERTSPTSLISEIRQQDGRKIVCYRDGHCEVH